MYSKPDPFVLLFARLEKIPGRWFLKDGKYIRHSSIKEINRPGQRRECCCPMAAPLAAEKRPVDNMCVGLFEETYGLTWSQVQALMAAADQGKSVHGRPYNRKLRSRLLRTCNLQEIVIPGEEPRGKRKTKRQSVKAPAPSSISPAPSPKPRRSSRRTGKPVVLSLHLSIH